MGTFETGSPVHKERREQTHALGDREKKATSRKEHVIVFSEKLSKIKDSFGLEISFTPVNESHALPVKKY